MRIVNRKHYKLFYIIFFSLFLYNCQLNKPSKTHGINFLDNRGKILLVGTTNKNDIIKLIGSPHTTSVKEKNTWIYFERTITRGKIVTLGKNVLKKNNILELKFDKYGILSSKKMYSKLDMNKVKYTAKKTNNTITQQSFINKFLSSIKQKMYGKRQN
jgi:outer membrane protein assembly factor BamE (lipoprotein component of BamABCDE complex)